MKWSGTPVSWCSWDRRFCLSSLNADFTDYHSFLPKMSQSALSKNEHASQQHITFFFFFPPSPFQLASGQTPGELLTPLVLNSILSKALQYSLHGDTPLAGNFTFALRFLPETFHPHAPDSLNCLELRYKVRLSVLMGWMSRAGTLAWVCLSQPEWQLDCDRLSCFDKLLWVWKMSLSRT